MAIGNHIHDAYSAAEKALERAVEIADGGVPLGRTFHRDLIRRAAIPIPGVRPPIIAPETEAALLRLVGFGHAFRHVYGGFDDALVEPNLAIAREAIPRLREDLDRFARLTGILPGA